jgi:hypothetical protein
MRLLTRAEAIVIQSLLASEAVTGREHIRRSGLPTRTFEVARQRVLAAGWVRERYIPSPSLLGRSKVSIVFAQPYAEHIQNVVRSWNRIDGNVLLWRGETSVLGVFFRSPTKPSLRQTSQLGNSEIFSRVGVFEVDTRDSEIPAYFDFEGAWSRIVREQPPVSYPHSFPEHARFESRPRELSPSEFRLMEFVTRSGIEADGAVPTDGPLRQEVGREEITRALKGGLVSRRVYLSLQSLPGYGTWSLRQIAFLTGRVRHPSEGNFLLQTLNTQIGLTPFLFVIDGADLLCGLLSPSPERLPNGRRPEGLSVIGAVQDSLSEIQVTREPVDEFAALVDHRYDRLFS